MNIIELYEGTDPKMPGAFNGVQVMTPQQFVAKAGDMPGEEVDEGSTWKDSKAWKSAVGDFDRILSQMERDTPAAEKQHQQGVKQKIKTNPMAGPKGVLPEEDSSGMGQGKGDTYRVTMTDRNGKYAGTIYRNSEHYPLWVMLDEIIGYTQTMGQGGRAKFDFYINGKLVDWKKMVAQGLAEPEWKKEQRTSDHDRLATGTNESEDHLNRIRKLSGLEEATALPASSRELGGQEFQDYMTRIKGTDDLDKEGNVKVDKKGIAKYTTGKTKTDKYKMPYIHRSSAIEYYDEGGKKFKEEAVIEALKQRPKKLLKQNEKMKHSNGEFEQFFNVGFAALTGVAVDESTNKLIIVNTCPGAGSCKVDCFAMKGGKVQFKAAWLSDGRILTYLLNDPTGFFNQLSSEISSEEKAATKGDKKFPNGWQVTVRWHDAGDFFSPEYLDMALKMAAQHPNVKFYAYTKMAGAALAKKPDNFIINWSEGANTQQEKQVKQQDPNLEQTKNSRIVPEKLFYDLLAKDEKGNLKKTADGAWQPASPEALMQMKQRIAQAYSISPSSILSYTEYMNKRNSIPAGMKYNVIVAPGEGDVSANDPGVLSTLLLRH